MKKLGASLPFAGAAGADFSGISDASYLFISKVVHQAVVEINEEGTEAAAATAVIIATNCIRLQPKLINFICNRPFLFFIADKTRNSILFMGKYSIPV
jgi:serpin B